MRILIDEQNRVAVGAVDCSEKRAGFRARLQGGLKIFGHRSPAGWVVGPLPAAAGFRLLDGFEAGGLHSSGFDEGHRFVAIDLRPDTPRRSRQKSLQPGLVVLRSFLPVDPAVTERGLERFRVRDGLNGGALLPNAEPHSRMPAVIFLEPRRPLRLVFEQTDRAWCRVRRRGPAQAITP